MAKTKENVIQVFSGTITYIHRNRHGVYFLSFDYGKQVIEGYTLPEDAVTDMKERAGVKDYHDLVGKLVKVYEYKGNFASFDLM